MQIYMHFNFLKLHFFNKNSEMEKSLFKCITGSFIELLYPRETVMQIYKNNHLKIKAFIYSA